jgi:AraC family transcriptional activator of pobA
MKQRKDIEYVELDTIKQAEQPGAFFFQHFIENSYHPQSPDAPHRHNFQELFIVQSGSGKHAIDGQSIELRPGTVSLIGKGHVHLVEHVSDFTGWVVRFGEDFLPAEQMSQARYDYAALFNQLGRNHSLTIQPADLDDLRVVLDLIEAEWSAAGELQQEHALRHLLALLIIRLERIYQRSLGAAQHERDEERVYQEFMAVLEREFALHHDVLHYAAALEIAPTRLSRILGRIVGKTTKQLINQRIMLEAKRYLHYTDLSVTEIAVALGYSDMFQFSKTFKRLAGVAPNAFREQRQKVT